MQTASIREKRMWRHNECFIVYVGPDFIQSVEVLRFLTGVVNKNMASFFDRDFHPGNQGNSMAPGIIRQVRRPDIQVMARNGENLESKPGGSLDQLLRGITADAMVFGIQIAVCMHLRFQPAPFRFDFPVQNCVPPVCIT